MKAGNMLICSLRAGHIAQEENFILCDTRIVARTFLKMLFFDHLQNDQPGLQLHAFSILDDHNVKVSKQALDKRFNDKAVSFIKKLFEIFLNSNFAKETIPSNLYELFSGIRIMNST